MQTNMDEQTDSTEGGTRSDATQRRRQRFFVPGPLAAGTTVAVDELAQQLAHVLRMQVGDELVLLDGGGQEFLARLTALSRNAASAEVLQARTCAAEPRIHLSLYQCSLKQDRFEWVLQKGTELGVSRFTPVIAQRSIVRPAAALLKKYVRWHAIVREAAEQCGRARIPELTQPLDWASAVKEAQGLRLLPWEEAQAAPSLLAILQQSMPFGNPVSILIGSEGGISKQEADLAFESGWQLVSLGPRILRAETAALAAVALWAGAQAD